MQQSVMQAFQSCRLLELIWTILEISENPPTTNAFVAKATEYSTLFDTHRYHLCDLLIFISS